MTVKRILCLVLALSLLCPALVGCKSRNKEDPPAPTKDPTEKESALQAASAARDFLSSVTSYRETVSTKLTFPYAESTVTFKNVDDVRYYGIGGANFFCEQVSTATTAMGGAQESETRLSGYQNGKMYLADGKTKLCSPLSADEYAAYLSLNADGQNYLSELESSERVGYRKDGDGYSITFTDVSAEKLSALQEKFASLSLFSGSVTVENVSVTVKLDADAKPQETKMDFSFSKSAYSMSVVTSYSEWNAVSATPTVNLSDYVETGDLRKISEISDAVEAIKKQSPVSFTLTERTSKESGSRTAVESSESTVNVSSSPAYAYTVNKITSAGAALDYSYQNGEESVVTKLKSGEEFGRQKNAVTEAEAKAKIASLLSVGDLSVQGVSSVTVCDGSVTLILDTPDVTEQEKDYTVLTSAAMLEVFYENGAIVSYTYTLVIDGIDMNAASEVSLVVEKTVDLH